MVPPRTKLRYHAKLETREGHLHFRIAYIIIFIFVHFPILSVFSCLFLIHVWALSPQVEFIATINFHPCQYRENNKTNALRSVRCCYQFYTNKWSSLENNGCLSICTIWFCTNIWVIKFEKYAESFFVS